MKKRLSFMAIFVITGLITHADGWIQKFNYPDINLSTTFSFTIGNYGYIGCGLTTNATITYSDAFWQYNPQTDGWTQMANFAGVPRHTATGVTIGGKGYAGLGRNSLSNLNDWWQYDPAANTWTQLANYGGPLTGYPVAFAIDNTVYVGTGYISSPYATGQMWAFDPINNQWTQKATLGGVARCDALGFSINNKGYIVGGYDGSNVLNDAWEYDATLDSWAQKASLPGAARCDAVCFVIGNSGYVCTGEGPSLSQYLNDLWEFNPVLNVWTAKASFPGMARDQANGFAIGNKGYAGIGCQNGSFPNIDWWEYTPDSVTSVANLLPPAIDFQISPIPAKDFVNIYLQHSENKKNVLTIIDLSGKVVFTHLLTSQSYIMDVSNFNVGVYIARLNDGKQCAVKKFIKQ